MDRLRSPLIVILAGVALAAVVAAVILVSGGDGDSEPASSKAPTPPDSTRAGAKKPADSTAAKPSPDRSGQGVTDTTAEADSQPSRAEIRRKLKVVPPEQRRQFAQTAALSILHSYGYPNVTVRLSKNGQIVAVFIPPGDACAVDLARVPEVKRALLRTILFARRVRVKVFGGGRLARYVRGNCKPLEIPQAPGRVVWSASGTGLRGSDDLQITSNRFTVAFVNNSGNLEIYVSRSQQLIEPVIKSQTRETGSQTYAGPGTFRVTVTGSGSWEVRVYDGA